MTTKTETRMYRANKDYEVTAEIKYEIDNHYGEDADGNRGMSVSYIDEVDITKIVSDDGVNIPLHRVSNKVFAEMEDLFDE